MNTIPIMNAFLELSKKILARPTANIQKHIKKYKTQVLFIVISLVNGVRRSRSCNYTFPAFLLPDPRMSSVRQNSQLFLSYCEHPCETR